MTLAEIEKLPQLTTSVLRELQWQIDWFAMAKREAKASTEIAWRAYNDAIDADEPKEQINTLFEVATMFDAIRVDAYHKFENAKRDYLAVLN
jgi:hypothetical protein